MYVLEVYLNGRRVAVAGTEDLCVLSTTVTATGKLGRLSGGTKTKKQDADARLHVGGLTSRAEPQEDEHLTWVGQKPLKVGDRVEVRLLKANKAHRHKSTSPAGGNVKAQNEKRWFEMAKKEYFRLREKYESER